MLVRSAFNYSCPLVLQISYLASTLLSLSNCNWFSKKEALGVFQFTSSPSRHQKTNLSCSAGHIYLPQPGTCPYRWPHASSDSNGCELLLFFMEEAINIGFQKAGIHSPASPPACAQGQWHLTNLFSPFRSIPELRGV